MKKISKLFSILFIAVFVLASCSRIAADVSFDDCKPIDNSYNNYQAGGKLFVNNSSLIYDCHYSDFVSGYYRISDGFATAIGGNSFFGFTPTRLNGIYPHDGEFYLISDDRKLQKYSFSVNKLTESEISLEFKRIQFYDGYLYYLYSTDRQLNLYRIRESYLKSGFEDTKLNNRSELVIKNVNHFAVCNQKVYCTRDEEFGAGYTMIVYPLNGGETKQYGQVGYTDTMLVFDEGVAVVSRDVYWLNRNDEMEKIWSYDGKYYNLHANAYGSKIYVITKENGLFYYDVLTKQKKIISKDILSSFPDYDDVQSIYIVDDKYIYIELQCENEYHETSRLLIRSDTEGNLRRVFPMK